MIVNQISIGDLLNVGVTIVVIACSWFFWLRRKLDAFDTRLRHIEQGLTKTSSAMAKLVGCLNEKDSLDKKRVTEVIETLGAWKKIDEDLASAGNNPLTPYELNALREYAKMARAGDMFTPDQAQEFCSLSKRFQDDYPKSDGAFWLGLVATFVLGLWIGGGGKDGKK